MLRYIFIVLIMASVADLNAQSLVQHLLHAEDYNSLYVKGDCEIDLRYNPDSIGYVVIRSTMQMYENVEKVLASDALYISVPLAVNASQRRKELQPIIVYAPTRLNSVTLSERCVLKSNEIRVGDGFTLTISGHSLININALTATDVNASVSGTGKIIINGPAMVSHINCSVMGSGRVVVDKLLSKTLSATLRGSGQINVAGTVSESSSVVVKGRGDVNMGDLSTGRLRAAVYGDGTVTYSPQTKCEALGNKNNINKISD